MYCILNVVKGQEKSVAENELRMASTIQESMLPRIFPPFPDRNEFDVYASMNPAKEVGGDFYDIFLVDDDHLALVIADVSGKGVPAALYMMVCKSLIKSQTLSLGADAGPGKILFTINNQLSDNNTLNMFVTVWLGILKISTGELTYANAGHEYPVFKKGKRPYAILKEKHSAPLGCMENIRYRDCTAKMLKGDILFLYTDGIAEANNNDNVLFGTDRLLGILNSQPGAEKTAKEIDKAIKTGVDVFVDGAAQFDDMTMLTFRYLGPEEGQTRPAPEPKPEGNAITVPATDANLDKVQDFINDTLDRTECTIKAQTQIGVAVEEIFINICHYAYGDSEGKATIRIEEEDGVATIVFEDSGMQYDPLAKEDPDVTLPASARKIGGLGIFITKRVMDSVTYEYKDNKNILTLKKTLC